MLTGNSRGHMKVWDLRNDRDVPATTFMLSDQVKVSLTRTLNLRKQLFSINSVSASIIYIFFFFRFKH